MTRAFKAEFSIIGGHDLVGTVFFITRLLRVVWNGVDTTKKKERNLPRLLMLEM